MKRVRNADSKLDKKRGITFDKQIVGNLSIEERSFLLKDQKHITEAYLKYIHKEEWFLKAKKKFPEFQKDKSIKNQEAQKAKLWESIFKVCENLIT